MYVCKREGQEKKREIWLTQRGQKSFPGNKTTDIYGRVVGINMGKARKVNGGVVYTKALWQETCTLEQLKGSTYSYGVDSRWMWYTRRLRWEWGWTVGPWSWVKYLDLYPRSNEKPGWNLSIRGSVLLKMAWTKSNELPKPPESTRIFEISTCSIIFF